MLFTEDIYHIGQTLATSKALFIPFSGQENVYRWHQYEVNLLGDPDNLARNLSIYIAGFSSRARLILEKFKFVPELSLIIFQA